MLVLAGCSSGGGGNSQTVAPPPTDPPTGSPPPTEPPPTAQTDFRDEIIYFALTDRFDNGDSSNDNGRGDRPGDSADRSNPVGWHGGDFAGLQRKIEEGYFARMGFTAIWISPVVLQVPPPGNGGGVNADKPFVGFHGYWAEDFFDIEPHFGSLADLKALAQAAKTADIQLVIDVVVNHAGPGAGIVATRPDWFRTGSECGTDDVTGCLFGLPDFIQEVPDVTDYLLETVAFLVTEIDPAGIRMDTMKHVPDSFWADFFAPGSPADPATLWTVGEVFSSSVPQIAHYLDDVGSPSLLDFPLRGAILDSLARGASTGRLADVFAQDDTYVDPTRLSTFLDNHDVPRFVTESISSGKSDAEAERRLDMALSLIYFARGTPVVYYGTEIAMRGAGDSYALPIGESSREDMDFDALAESAIDERLAELAAAREEYIALRRGAQRTLFAPGSSCQPAPTGLDPAETFGETLYVRGSFDGWANPPPASQSFVNRGAAQYQAMTEIGAGNQEFKIAAADWSVEFANVDEPTRLGVPITLSTASGAGTNSRISIPLPGCYAFDLDANNRVRPVLTVSSQSAAGGDPDVFVFARSLADAAPIIVIVNNENNNVDMSALADGGINVSGLFDDGPLTELTGAGQNLEVADGRLLGLMPALTVFALTGR
jgi:glycosidase